MKKQSNIPPPCCGSCACFGNEDAYGGGWCSKEKKNRHCSDKRCGRYQRK